MVAWRQERQEPAQGGKLSAKPTERYELFSTGPSDGWQLTVCISILYFEEHKQEQILLP